MATKELARAYAACARITRREARNFHYAFASLPRPQRLAVYALYAFCREADDCVDVAPSMDALSTSAKSEKPALLLDGDLADRVANAHRGIAMLRERLAAAVGGRPITERDVALADAIERYGVSPDDLADVIAGVEMDLTRTRYATFDDLREYCYHVASAVGLATLPILNDGIPPTDAMREHAVDLGLGMQLVNILRDVAEDLARDRVYLPQEELHRFGVDQSALARGVMTEPLRLLLAFLAARGVEYLERGSQLLPHVPRSGRPCLWLLAEIYGRLLHRIIAADYAVFAGRVSLPKWEKLGLLAAARWRA